LASWLQWGRQGQRQILGEMARTVLPDYAWTTVRLCVMVAVGVAAGGRWHRAAVTVV
jgi:iron(III) transport system permease protein